MQIQDLPLPINQKVTENKNTACYVDRTQTLSKPLSPFGFDTLPDARSSLPLALTTGTAKTASVSQVWLCNCSLEI
ncbi:hypothetical protein [Nostoc sp.]